MGSNSSRSRSLSSLDPKARKAAAMAGNAGAGAGAGTGTDGKGDATSFIDVWRDAATEAGLEKFAGPYTKDQIKMFQKFTIIFARRISSKC